MDGYKTYNNTYMDKISSASSKQINGITEKFMASVYFYTWPSMVFGLGVEVCVS